MHSDIGPDAHGRNDTGDEHVDRALDRLHDLDSTDVSRHAAIYDDIQQALSGVLDAGPATPLEQ